MKKYQLTCDIEAESLEEALGIAANLPKNFAITTSVPEGLVDFHLAERWAERPREIHVWFRERNE